MTAVLERAKLILRSDRDVFWHHKCGSRPSFIFPTLDRYHQHVRPQRQRATSRVAYAIGKIYQVGSFLWSSAYHFRSGAASELKREKWTEMAWRYPRLLHMIFLYHGGIWRNGRERFRFQDSRCRTQPRTISKGCSLGCQTFTY
jgi:hypothetical protein